MNELLKTRNARFRLDGDVLLATTVRGRTTAESMAEGYAAIDQLLDGHRVKVLWDARLADVAPDGWVTIISGIQDRFSAIATIIDEATVTNWETYQAAITSMLIPFELFDDEIRARTWLDGIAG